MRSKILSKVPALFGNKETFLVESVCRKCLKRIYVEVTDEDLKTNFEAEHKVCYPGEPTVYGSRG